MRFSNFHILIWALASLMNASAYARPCSCDYKGDAVSIEGLSKILKFRHLGAGGIPGSLSPHDEDACADSTPSCYNSAMLSASQSCEKYADDIIQLGSKNLAPHLHFAPHSASGTLKYQCNYSFSVTVYLSTNEGPANKKPLRKQFSGTFNCRSDFTKATDGTLKQISPVPLCN